MTGDGQVEFGVRACDRLRTHYELNATCKSALEDTQTVGLCDVLSEIICLVRLS